MINLEWNQIQELHKSLKKKKISKNANIMFSIQMLNQKEPILLKHKFSEFEKVMWSLWDSQYTVGELAIAKDSEILYHFKFSPEILEIIPPTTNKLVLNWNKLKQEERKAHINITISEISNE